VLNNAVVTLDNVGFAYAASKPLFSGLSAMISRGTITAVSGPSGRGKSTLLSLLAGMQMPTTGTVTRDQLTAVRWVLQTPIAVSRRTCLDQIVLQLFAGRLLLEEAREQAVSILKLVGLEDRADIPFGLISGGEAQRLMLARAIAAMPDLMLLDEPTAQLDARSARSVIDTIRSTTRFDCAVVVATHDIELVSACDQVIEL